jgi:hypothetical protein
MMFLSSRPDMPPSPIPFFNDGGTTSAPLNEAVD